MRNAEAEAETFGGKDYMALEYSGSSFIDIEHTPMLPSCKCMTEGCKVNHRGLMIQLLKFGFLTSSTIRNTFTNSFSQKVAFNALSWSQIVGA